LIFASVLARGRDFLLGRRITEPMYYTRGGVLLGFSVPRWPRRL